MGVKTWIAFIPSIARIARHMLFMSFTFYIFPCFFFFFFQVVATFSSLCSTSPSFLSYQPFQSLCLCLCLCLPVSISLALAQIYDSPFCCLFFFLLSVCLKSLLVFFSFLLCSEGKMKRKSLNSVGWGKYGWMGLFYVHLWYNVTDVEVWGNAYFVFCYRGELALGDGYGEQLLLFILSLFLLSFSSLYSFSSLSLSLSPSPLRLYFSTSVYSLFSLLYSQLKGKEGSWGKQQKKNGEMERKEKEDETHKVTCGCDIETLIPYTNRKYK